MFSKTRISNRLFNSTSLRNGALLGSLGALLGLLPLGGCFLRQNTVVEKFVGEFRCPKEQVKVEQPDKKGTPDIYRASGCNRRANYKCSGDYGEFCERLGQPETIKPEAGAIDTAPAGAPASPDAPAQSGTTPAQP